MKREEHNDVSFDFNAIATRAKPSTGFTERTIQAIQRKGKQQPDSIIFLAGITIVTLFILGVNILQFKATNQNKKLTESELTSNNIYSEGIYSYSYYNTNNNPTR